MTAKSQRSAATAVLAVASAMAVAALARGWGIDDQPLWLDETLTLWFARQPFAELWGGILEWEPHPPLYYSLQRLWLGFGDGSAALRALAAVFGVLTVPLVFLIAQTAQGRTRGVAAGLLAALLFALAPLQVQFGQEARVYAALAAAQTLLLAGAVWLVRHPSAMAVPPWHLAAQPGAWRPAAAWMAVVGGAGFSLWLHNTAVLFVAVLLLFTIVWITVEGLWRREVAINLAIATTLVVLVWTPYLPWLWQHARAVGQSFWIAPPGPAEIVWTLRDLFGSSYLWRLNPVVEVLFAGLAAWGARHLARQRGWPVAALLLSAAFLPVLVHVVVSLTVTPIFLTRPLISSAVPYYVLIAAGVMAIPWKILRVAVFVGLVLVQARASANFAVTFARTPWNEIAATLRAEARDGDLVYVYPHFVALPLEHALGGGDRSLDLRPLPAPFPAGGAQAQPLGPAERQVLRQQRQRQPRAWLVLRAAKHLLTADEIERAVRLDRRVTHESEHRLIRLRRYE